MINPSNIIIDKKFDNISSRKKRRRKPKGKFCIGARRKRKEDNIRKKIKSSFHKYIRLYINKNLKKAGSKYFFENLPQHFIADISKKINYKAMQLTFGELFEFAKDNLEKDENYKKRVNYVTIIGAAIKKCNRNKKTLEYLDSNPEISEKSGWKKIKNTLYVDLLKEYFNPDSDSFKQLIEKLSKKEDKAYMDSFKFFSENYVKFFLNYNSNEEDSQNKNNNDMPNGGSSPQKNNIIQSPYLNETTTRSSPNNSTKSLVLIIPEEIMPKKMKLFSYSYEDSESEKSLSFGEFEFILDNDNYSKENFGLIKNGNN